MRTSRYQANDDLPVDHGGDRWEGRRWGQVVGRRDRQESRKDRLEGRRDRQEGCREVGGL